MDELNLYEDLDDFQEQQEKKSKELEDVEEKLQQSLKTIGELQDEIKTLRKNIKRMELGFQSLLDTARAEINRKNKEIQRLNKEKDDICFRRKKMVQKGNTNEKSQMPYQSIVNPFMCNTVKVDETSSAENAIAPTKNLAITDNFESDKRYREQYNERNNLTGYKRYRSTRDSQDDKYNTSSHEHPKDYHKIRYDPQDDRTRHRDNNETELKNNIDRNRSRDRKDSKYIKEKSLKSSENSERYCNRSDRNKSREPAKIDKKYQKSERSHSREYNNRDTHLRPISSSSRNKTNTKIDSNHTHGQKDTSLIRAEPEKSHYKKTSVGLSQEKSSDFKVENYHKQAHLVTRENPPNKKLPKTAIRKPDSGNLNVNIPKKHVEQEGTQKSSNASIKGDQKINSDKASSKESENEIQAEATKNSSLPEADNLCTPRKVAIFNEIFGKSPIEGSAMQTNPTNSLLSNIKEILAKTSQIEVVSSATTSPGDYTDVNSCMSTPIGKTIEITSSASSTADSIKNNQETVKNLEQNHVDRNEIDMCFIPTHNLDQKNIKTIACVELTKIVEDDIANELEFIKIPGLDFCAEWKETTTRIETNIPIETETTLESNTKKNSTLKKDAAIKSLAIEYERPSLNKDTNENNTQTEQIIDIEDCNSVNEKRSVLSSDDSIEIIETSSNKGFSRKIKENTIEYNSSEDKVENELINSKKNNKEMKSIKNLDNKNQQVVDDNSKYIFTKENFECLAQKQDIAINNENSSAEKTKRAQKAELPENLPNEVVVIESLKSGGIVPLKNPYNTNHLSQDTKQHLKDPKDKTLTHDIQIRETNPQPCETNQTEIENISEGKDIDESKSQAESNDFIEYIHKSFDSSVDRQLIDSSKLIDRRKNIEESLAVELVNVKEAELKLVQNEEETLVSNDLLQKVSNSTSYLHSSNKETNGQTSRVINKEETFKEIQKQCEKEHASVESQDLYDLETAETSESKEKNYSLLEREMSSFSNETKASDALEMITNQESAVETVNKIPEDNTETCKTKEGSVEKKSLNRSTIVQITEETFSSPAKQVTSFNVSEKTTPKKYDAVFGDSASEAHEGSIELNTPSKVAEMENIFCPKQQRTSLNIIEKLTDTTEINDQDNIVVRTSSSQMLDIIYNNAEKQCDTKDHRDSGESIESENIIKDNYNKIENTENIEQIQAFAAKESHKIVQNEGLTLSLEKNGASIDSETMQTADIVYQNNITRDKGTNLSISKEITQQSNFKHNKDETESVIQDSNCDNTEPKFISTNVSNTGNKILDSCNSAYNMVDKTPLGASCDNNEDETLLLNSCSSRPLKDDVAAITSNGPIIKSVDSVIIEDMMPTKEDIPKAFDIVNSDSKDIFVKIDSMAKCLTEKASEQTLFNAAKVADIESHISLGECSTNNNKNPVNSCEQARDIERIKEFYTTETIIKNVKKSENLEKSSNSPDSLVNTTESKVSTATSFENLLEVILTPIQGPSLETVSQAEEGLENRSLKEPISEKKNECKFYKVSEQSSSKQCTQLTEENNKKTHKQIGNLQHQSPAANDYENKNETQSDDIKEPAEKELEIIYEESNNEMNTTLDQTNETQPTNVVQNGGSLKKVANDHTSCKIFSDESNSAKLIHELPANANEFKEGIKVHETQMLVAVVAESINSDLKYHLETTNGFENKNKTQSDDIKEPSEKELDSIRTKTNESNVDLDQSEEVITTLISADSKSLHNNENEKQVAKYISYENKATVNSHNTVNRKEGLEVKNVSKETDDSLNNEGKVELEESQILDDFKSSKPTQNTLENIETSKAEFACHDNETNNELVSSSYTQDLCMNKSGGEKIDTISLHNQSPKQDVLLEVFTIENVIVQNKDKRFNACSSLKESADRENVSDPSTLVKNCISTAKHTVNYNNNYETSCIPQGSNIDNINVVEVNNINTNPAKRFTEVTKITKEINIEGEIVEVVKSYASVNETLNIKDNVGLPELTIDTCAKIECSLNKTEINNSNTVSNVYKTSPSKLGLYIAAITADKEIPLIEVKAANKEDKYLLNKEIQYQSNQYQPSTPFELKENSVIIVQKDCYPLVLSTIPDTYNTIPELPSISTTSPTPSNFSGIFSKKSSPTDATEDEVIKSKKKSPHFTTKPKEYILPAASVLCNVDNLENATKVNKKLHWELLDSKNEMTEIEDDADVDTTDDEHMKMKKEPLRDVSIFPKQCSLQKSSLSETDTQTENESLLRDLRQQKGKCKKLKLSKAYKTKHVIQKVPKNVKATLKAVGMPNADTIVTKNTEIILQHKKRGRKPKAIIGNSISKQEYSKNKLDTSKEREPEAEDVVLETKSNTIESLKVTSNYGEAEEQNILKSDSTCVENMPEIVKNMDNLSTSVGKLEICHEPNSSKDSTKLGKSFTNQINDFTNKNAFSTSVSYHKQDSLALDKGEKSTSECAKQLEEKGKDESLNSKHLEVTSSSKEPEDMNSLNKTDCNKDSASSDTSVQFIEKNKTKTAALSIPLKSRTIQENSLLNKSNNEKNKVLKDKKSLKDKPPTKQLLKKNYKSKSITNKGTNFISLEDIGIQVRPPKFHLSSFRIPKLKKDPEDIIDNSWKLETYVEMDNETEKKRLIEGTKNEKEIIEYSEENCRAIDKQMSNQGKHLINKEQREQKIMGNTKLNKTDKKFNEIQPHLAKKLSNDQTKNSSNNYITNNDNRTKTGKRKLFSPDKFDEDKTIDQHGITAGNKNSDGCGDQGLYLNKIHEPNPVKVRRKSSQCSSHITSSSNTTLSKRRRSINIHRRILDSSCDEDDVNKKNPSSNEFNTNLQSSKLEIDMKTSNVLSESQIKNVGRKTWDVENKTVNSKLNDKPLKSIKLCKNAESVSSKMSSTDSEKLSNKSCTQTNLLELKPNEDENKNLENSLSLSKKLEEITDQGKPVASYKMRKKSTLCKEEHKKDTTGVAESEHSMQNVYGVTLLDNNSRQQTRLHSDVAVVTIQRGKSVNLTSGLNPNTVEREPLNTQEQKVEDENKSSKTHRKFTNQIVNSRRAEQDLKTLSVKVTSSVDITQQINPDHFSSVVMTPLTQHKLIKIREKSSNQSQNLNPKSSNKKSLNQNPKKFTNENHIDNSNFAIGSSIHTQTTSKSSVVLTHQKTITTHSNTVNHRRILDSSSEENDEPLAKKSAVIPSEAIVPSIEVTKPKQRKRRVVKVLSTSLESPTNATNTSQLSASQPSPLTSPMLSHPIFNTEVSTHTTEFAASLPLIPNQQDDTKFKEIDSKLNAIFQSPQYAVDYKTSSDMAVSNPTILSTTLNDSQTNISIDERVDLVEGNNISSSNISQISKPSACLNDTMQLHNNSEIKHLSLGTADYRFEKVSDNVINLFISRKRKRKRNN